MLSRSRIFQKAIFVEVFLLIALAALASRKSAHAYTDQDAYAVYSAVLPHLWPWTQLDAQNFVILNETKGHRICAASTAGQSNLHGGNNPGNDAHSMGNSRSLNSAIANYKQMNQQPWILQHKLHISRSYTFIGRGELEGIARQEIGAWGLFFEHHEDSGGWIQFSAVGFNASRTTAVVYAAYQCGRNCGGGAFYVLKKKGNQWKMSNGLPNACGDDSMRRQMTGL